MHLRAIAAIAAAFIAAPALAQPTPPALTPAQPTPPELSLPTPPGEEWRVIQGYGCGTHDDPVDFYALDLLAADGNSLGAPVRAAAPGTVMAWVEPSGTLIVEHGEGFFTMYTHMEPFLTERGAAVARGSLVGYVGERATPGNPHLHFALYTQPPGYDEAVRAARRSLPLRFSEGYDLPDIGGCSQHAGASLIAAGGEGRISPRIILRHSVPAAPGELIYCPVQGGLCMR